jgi:hypothetical protein
LAISELGQLEIEFVQVPKVSLNLHLSLLSNAETDNALSTLFCRLSVNTWKAYIGYVIHIEKAKLKANLETSVKINIEKQGHRHTLLEIHPTRDEVRRDSMSISSSTNLPIE